MTTKQEPWYDDFGDMATLTSATSTQVGGDHYTKQGIQPLESTFANFGYSGVQASIYTKVNKYLTRDKGTDRADITKAIHCLELQLGFYDLAYDDTLDVLDNHDNNEAIDKEGNV